ncbi:GNAT family N-acetyltransferase [Pontibacter toksunensis]|uniref:GNAT family N-acetyltransferase n=1 Tax=Pontibacter toksunensis TaxID=1332631 RepID=A0ABW6BZ45_9BACT
MIELKRIDQEQDLKAAYSIREKVFVIEQQVPADAEYDQYEGAAKHYLATYEGTPCGAARWRVTDKGVKLERFAVLPAYRNKKVGAKLLEAVLEDVQREHPDKEIYLHAQLTAVNFYKRNGFEAEGDLFSECDIQHYKMIYRD